MASIEKKQRQNRDGTDKKKRKKPKLKQIYTEEPEDEVLEAQPASSLIAVPSEPEVPEKDALAEPRSIFLEDKRPYEPGAGFVLRQEESSLSCTGLDSSTHEVWLLQLPINWESSVAAKVTTKPERGEGVLGHCSSETGVEYSLIQEHASLAAPLFVASPTLKDGKPAQIQRRVTLVRSSGPTGEEENGAPSEQRQPAAPSGAAAPETPKKKRAKIVKEGAQQPGAVELRLEDIMVKQESPDGKKRKKKRKDKGTSGAIEAGANP